MEFTLADSGRKYKSPKPAKSYRNPVAITQEWQEMLTFGGYTSAAELACTLGMSRARVTQVLSFLRLHPEVLQQIAALGDPLPAPIVTERKPRDVSKLSATEQKRWAATFFER